MKRHVRVMPPSEVRLSTNESGTPVLRRCAGRVRGCEHQARRPRTDPAGGNSPGQPGREPAVARHGRGTQAARALPARGSTRWRRPHRTNQRSALSSLRPSGCSSPAANNQAPNAPNADCSATKPAPAAGRDGGAARIPGPRRRPNAARTDLPPRIAISPTPPHDHRLLNSAAAPAGRARARASRSAARRSRTCDFPRSQPGSPRHPRARVPGPLTAHPRSSRPSLARA